MSGTAPMPPSFAPTLRRHSPSKEIAMTLSHTILACTLVAATVAGGIAAIAVTLLWAVWFPQLRQARSFEIAESIPDEAAIAGGA